MLTHKTAVVTGAGGGIGRECAKVLAREHAHVLLIGRHEENIKETAKQIAEEGYTATYFQCDVAQKEDLKRLGAYMEKLGKIDILVNNAALFLKTDILKRELEAEWEKMIQVNICGVIEMVHLCLPYMMTEEGASIINLASVDAFAGCQNYTGYSMTKGAVVSFSRSLALDIGKYGIRVNVVAPGITDTPMTHERIEKNKEKYLNRLVLKRIGTDTDIANAILFLASDRSSYITGEVLNVNGGLQFV